MVFFFSLELAELSLHDEESHFVKAVINIKNFVAANVKKIASNARKNDQICKHIQTQLEFLLLTTKKLIGYTKDDILSIRLPSGKIIHMYTYRQTDRQDFSI